MNNWSTILNNAKTAADIIAILRNVLAQLDSKSFTQIEELFKQTDLNAQQKLDALQALYNSADATTQAEITNLQSAINTAAAAGAGDNGWNALLVNYAQAGDGAITRNLQDKLRDSVNVRDFCLCNGTDESTAILKAMAYANSQNKALLLPYGYEVLISSTTVLNPTIGIYGGGRIRRTPTGWAKGYPAVMLNKPATFVRGITFVTSDTANVSIDTVAITTSMPASAWVEVAKGSSGCRVDGNIMRGARFGVWLYGGRANHVCNNDIRAMQETGIYFGSTSPSFDRPDGTFEIVDGTFITGNVIRNVSSVPVGGTGGDGIKVAAQAVNTVITHNDIRDNAGDAIDLFASGNSVTVSHNVLANNGVKGIDIKARYSDYPAATWGYNNQLIIENNIVFDNTYDGIVVSNVDNEVYFVRIAGNNVYGNQRYGIHFRGKTGEITGNFAYRNGTGDYGYSAGIRIEGDAAKPSSEINCTGNICINNGNSAFATSCGIVLFGYVNNVNIHNNQCYNYADVGLVNDGNQDFGIYVFATTTNISVLKNKSQGHAIAQIGWANGAGVVGETSDFSFSGINATTDRMLTHLRRNAAIVDYKVIPFATMAADAANYWQISIRYVSSDLVDSFVGNIQNSDTSIVGKTGATLSFIRTTATPAQDIGGIMYMRANKVGTAADIGSMLLQLNMVTW